METEKPPTPDKTSDKPPDKIRIILIVLQIFVGLGALMPGYSLITDPSGRGVGFPPGLIENTIFGNYLIPGLFLLGVNGLGNCLTALLGLLKHRYFYPLACLQALALIIWIGVQVLTVGLLYWLQPFFGLIGLLELFLAWKGLKKHGLA